MRIAAALLILAACGGGGGGGGDDSSLLAPTTCTGDGSGEVLGSVGGVSFAAVTGVSAVVDSGIGGVELTLQDSGEICESMAADHELVLFLCGDPPTSGTFDVTSTPDCSSNHAAATLLTNSSTATVLATGGSITVVMGTDECITGTFSLDFDDGSLDGTFGGEFCRSASGGD